MIAHLVASLGWTWDEAREGMDVPRLKSLNAYWAAHPPAHLTLAAAFGITAETPPESGNLSDLMTAFPETPRR